MSLLKEVTNNILVHPRALIIDAELTRARYYKKYNKQMPKFLLTQRLSKRFCVSRKHIERLLDTIKINKLNIEGVSHCE